MASKSWGFLLFVALSLTAVTVIVFFSQVTQVGWPLSAEAKLSYASAKGLRTAPKRYEAACWLGEESSSERRFDPTKYDTIYLFHSRKAGGSTLRRYLHIVANAFNLELRVDEAGASETPSDERTFYITSVRDPIKRSISHFKYSERWSCKQLLYNKEFQPSYENAKPFNTWITYDEPCKYKKHRNGTKICDKKLWTCSANCFVRWFSSPMETNMSKAYTTALNRIAGFDLILHTERYPDEDYVTAIEKFFGVRGFNFRNAFCAKESKVANTRFPLNISQSQMEELERRNYLDIQFYKRLFSCS